MINLFKKKKPHPKKEEVESGSKSFEIEITKQYCKDMGVETDWERDAQKIYTHYLNNFGRLRKSK